MFGIGEQSATASLALSLKGLLTWVWSSLVWRPVWIRKIGSSNLSTQTLRSAIAKAVVGGLSAGFATLAVGGWENLWRGDRVVRCQVATLWPGVTLPGFKSSSLRAVVN